MDRLELSLIQLGAEEEEAAQIAATLTHLLARTFQQDPARAACGLGSLIAVLREAVPIVSGRARTQEIENLLHRALADEHD